MPKPVGIIFWASFLGIIKDAPTRFRARFVSVQRAPHNDARWSLLPTHEHSHSIVQALDWREIQIGDDGQSRRVQCSVAGRARAILAPIRHSRQGTDCSLARAACLAND